MNFKMYLLQTMLYVKRLVAIIKTFLSLVILISLFMSGVVQG